MIIFWILSLITLALGFIILYVMNLNISPAFMPYSVVMFLVTADCFLFSALALEKNINVPWRILVRFIVELGFGVLLIYLGHQTEFDLYLVALIAIGVNLLINIHRVLNPQWESQIR